MKHKKWNVWIIAVFILVTTVGYGMYRLYQEADVTAENVIQSDEMIAEMISEEFLIETFSEPFLDEKLDEQKLDEQTENEKLGTKSDESFLESEVLIDDLKLFVYVCGEVQNPGVYALTEGSRVVDAVEAAGGFSEQAAKEYWNLADFVEDGMKIAVPSIEEVKENPYGWNGMNSMKNEKGLAGSTGNEKSGESEGLVNLNSADAELLQTLPGIGEIKAQDIIQYRETHGGFSSIEEIMEISGIKDAVFEKIKDKITVSITHHLGSNEP